MTARGNPWLRVGWDAWALGVESASVIGLRTLRLTAGGAAAQTEAELMVSEKMAATWALQVQAMTGGLGLSPPRAAAKVVRQYRRKVRANQRRLSA